MRIRRVGSITCGGLLILFGGLFFLRMLIPSITYQMIFSLWPLILVSLGVELLVSNLKAGENVLKYDTGAIVLMIVMAFFSMGMGIAEFSMKICMP